MYTIDEETGLPELPEGYYWHVRKSGLGSPYAYITIRKDKLVWGLFRLPYQYIETICKQTEITTVDGLRAQINRAWRLYGGEFSQLITPGQAINPYGSYPPKKLEA